jgi:uncharacterized phage protein (TIGR01671 family)
MNREIKFRAWMKKREKMTEVFTFEDFDENYFIPEGVYIRDMTIMQYTGLKDKNGKEIYSGDLIKDQGFIGKVIEDERVDGYCFTIKFPKEWKWQGNYDYEIIGNIYENPELLTNKQ